MEMGENIASYGSAQNVVYHVLWGKRSRVSYIYLSALGLRICMAQSHLRKLWRPIQPRQAIKTTC